MKGKGTRIYTQIQQQLCLFAYEAFYVKQNAVVAPLMKVELIKSVELLSDVLCN